MQNGDDPITKAAKASVGYTPQMHTDARERIIGEIYETQSSRRPFTPDILDLYETAIYHTALSNDSAYALHVYDDVLGGYGRLGGRLGDYRRGLRITSFLMSVFGADYMDVTVCPAHDHNLYLIALGQPEAAERQTRHLLEHAQAMAQAEQVDPKADNWTNPLAFSRERDAGGFAMYEAVFLQTWCEALLVQGKLQEAEAMMNDVLNQPRDWTTFGNVRKSRNGSNPYARRALARALKGDVQAAFDDFKAADTFAEEHTVFTLFRSRDWHHRTHYAAFLARLGYLSRAKRRLEAMSSERIHSYRPLTAAEFDLASAEIAYAQGDVTNAANYAESVLAWAAESGHRQAVVRARLIHVKVRLRANELDQASELLNQAQVSAKECGFAIQHIDGLILSGYMGLASGDIDRTEADAAEAETASEALGYRWGVGDAAHLRARCAEGRGEMGDALQHANRALSMRELIQDPKAHHTQALIERLKSKGE